MDGHNPNASATGLRDRKKARRREDILKSAGALFAEKGIDATTMADIAEAVEVSPPTIFNYFGNKDGLLIALISEGTSKARAAELAVKPRTDADFVTILVDTFVKYSLITLEIASKRIWRYAEAASIRRPGTELSRSYARVNEELVNVTVQIFDQYDLKLRSGQPADTRVLGRVFFDVWTTAYFGLICDEKRDLRQHRADLRKVLPSLAEMLFDDEFLKTPKLKP